MKTFTGKISRVVLASFLAMSVMSVYADEKKEEKTAKTESKSEWKWLNNFAEAKKQAKAEKKLILADFSGSDWCGWCMKLDEEVFSRKPFIEYASKHFVPLLVDFPSKKQQSPFIVAQNSKLSKKYNVTGFPTILILDADGKQIAKTGYEPGGAENYVKHLKKLIAKNK